MRTVFLGTSAFAAAVLERLAASPHPPSLVVTRPDRPRGRGRRLAPPPVAEVAARLGIELAQPENVNAPEARQLIADAAPDAVCVCAFGALIREPLLAEHLMLNVHPSLLPRWRGAAPIERATMAGDQMTGVSIMRLTAGLDSGPVCLTASEPISGEDTYGTLSARLQVIGAGLLVAALDGLPPCREQDESAATYADKIGPADRLLDPARPAVELERVVRALHPHIGARVQLPGGELLRVHASRVASASENRITCGSGAAPDEGETLELSAGEVAERDGRLLLGCTPGVLELLVVQPAGRRPMPADAFLRGRRAVGGAGGPAS